MLEIQSSKNNLYCIYVYFNDFWLKICLFYLCSYQFIWDIGLDEFFFIDILEVYYISEEMIFEY